MNWRVEVLEGPARQEVEDLPFDMQVKLDRIIALIEASGLHRVKEPYVKHLQGKLWEIRLSGRSGIVRSLYVTASGQRVVIVRTFVKKTEKTPRHEIELALQRAQGVLE